MRLHIVPWTLEGLDLGGNLLELGPGYGASTELLLPRCQSLTCVEYDPHLARKLGERFQQQFSERSGQEPGRQSRSQFQPELPPQPESGKVSVLHGDAADLELPDSVFDSAVCFMMLHHVLPAERQDRLFAEAFRILRPGGLFAGADSPAGPLLSFLHLGDKVAMVDPDRLADRLGDVGFEEVQLDRTRYAFRFRARKPVKVPSRQTEAAQNESSNEWMAS